MSKSSPNNNDINIAYLEKLTEAVTDMTITLQKISSNYGSSGQLEKTLQSLARMVNSGDMTLKQMLKQAANTQKNIRSVEYGLEDTTRYNKTVNMFIKLLEDKIGDSKIDDVLVDKLTTAFENLDVSAILESEKIGQRGGKGAPLKGVMDNEKLNKVNEDLAKRIGAKLDSAQFKLLSFFQSAPQALKKWGKGFASDLVEGLEKSKWVGGAMRDGFRLIGLLGASWLKQFGQLGNIIGAAFYVAMDTMGPILVEMLLRGMGKLFMNLPGLIGKFGWGNALGVGAGAIGAAWAFGEAKDSWESGKKGNAVTFGAGGTAMGAGAATLGVAGLASLGASAATTAGATGIAGTLSGIAAALGPIGWGILAIGAAIAGLAFVWKRYGDDIKEHFKKNKGFYDKVMAAMDFIIPPMAILRHTLEWIVDHWPWKDGGNHFIGGNNADKGTGITDNIIDNMKGNYVTYGKMKVSKRDGSILNLHELSQDEASEALQMYEKADPTSFNKVYEWVDRNHADFNSFQTDAVAKDKSGNIIAALGKKGQTKEIDELRDYLRAQGVPENLVNSLRMTSGKLTGSNKFHGVGGWKSHNNPYALGIDLAGGGSWGGSDYTKYLEIMQQFYRDKGYELRVESPGQFGKSTDWHYDIKPLKNIRPQGAQEVFSEYERAKKEAEKQEQKVTSDNAASRIEVASSLLEAVDPSLAGKIKKQASNAGNPLAKWAREHSNLAKNAQDATIQFEVEQALKARGIHRADNMAGNQYYMKDAQGNMVFITTPSGNVDFEKLQQMANTGVSRY